MWALDSRHGLQVHGQVDIGRFVHRPTVMGDGVAGDISMPCWWRYLWFSVDVDKAPEGLLGDPWPFGENESDFPLWIDGFDYYWGWTRSEWPAGRAAMKLFGTNFGE